MPSNLKDFASPCRYHERIRKAEGSRHAYLEGELRILLLQVTAQLNSNQCDFYGEDKHSSAELIRQAKLIVQRAEHGGYCNPLLSLRLRQIVRRHQSMRTKMLHIS